MQRTLLIYFLLKALLGFGCINVWLKLIHISYNMQNSSQKSFRATSSWVLLLTTLGKVSGLLRPWMDQLGPLWYLQQQDEVVHGLVPGVQVVARAQTVVVVEVDLLVDAGVAQQVEQNLLRHPDRTEVLHLWRSSEEEGDLKKKQPEYIFQCLAIYL